ncbi:MAG TPA: ankyrin repeat domain-containing protein [Burkholderiales bacterium]
MWRDSISRLIGRRAVLPAVALLLLASTSLQAQMQYFEPASARPDPVYYGVQLEAGNLPQVRAWLDAGMAPDYLADHIGTGLMIAAWNGNVPMMELLVARGADVNRRNALGESALMHAAWRGQVAAMRWLIGKGALVDSAPMQWGPLHYAVFAGQAEAAALLLDHGADVNARSTNGSSVLMMAVYEGHAPLVKDLLARGADPRAKNDRGEGALEWAFKFKHLGIARMVADPQEFAAAANQPPVHWGAPARSQPAPAAGPPVVAADPAADKIDELVRMRNTLAQRGMKDAVAKLDRRIAQLRMQRARAYKDSIPSAVLEISAKRAAPGEQSTRLIFDAGETPP